MVSQPSWLIEAFIRLIEFGNRWGTVGGFLFRSQEHIFRRIEIIVISLTLITTAVLFSIHLFPLAIGAIISVVLFQRIFEYGIVYSRNFILQRGRVFSHFPRPETLNQWIILMFLINLFQVLLVFAVWYRFLSIVNPVSFSQPLSALDSFYFSVVTFFTIGFGDIVPLTRFAKLLVIFEGLLAFYTVVIVINGFLRLKEKS